MRKPSAKKREVMKRQRHQQSVYKYTQSQEDLGLVKMPRCWIPEKDVEFFRGLARIVKEHYLRGKK